VLCVCVWRREEREKREESINPIYNGMDDVYEMMDVVVMVGGW
jgi:hypothetical protein